MAGETEGEVVVPPTLQALLAARLDLLETAERSVLERGAVEGEIFHRGAVQALAPRETGHPPRLAALVRKELIRPNKPHLAGEDGFRFRHLLIRDAAYDALPKAVRADLHERFAAWLEERGADLVELEEILGYHLEQACRYRAELGMPHDERLAAAARQRLAAAGRRALLRADNTAAASLLERAAALLPRPRSTSPWRPTLSTHCSGRAEATTRSGTLRSLAERAAAAGDRIGELCARIKEVLVRISFKPEGATDELADYRRAGDPGIRGRRRRPGSVHRLFRGRGGCAHASAYGRNGRCIREGVRPRATSGLGAPARARTRQWSFLWHDPGLGAARLAGRA